jgi:serine/threonine-protein kinase RsbW
MLSDSSESAEAQRGRDEVTVQLPADARFLGTLRGLARSLAAQCDLTVDELEDIQMAIDEAFVLLVPYADDAVGVATTISADFVLAARQVDVEVSIPSEGAPEPDQAGLSWTVLEALTDQVAVTAGGGTMAICFTKRRGPA